MAGYTRQSTFLDGDTITASLFNNEYNQLLNAFGNTSGHKHDGTANEGPVIGLIGDAGVITPLNKVLIDSTNDHIEFWIEVSSSSVQQLYIADGAIVPVTDNDIDLGTSSLQFKDLYINGTANIDSLVLATGSTVTAVLDEDDLSSDSATSLVTQQSVKAYIDAQVTAQDLDFLGDSGGALSIDLDSESLTIAGGTGLATVGSGNTITVNIDSTVTTLTGTQTLTNKTLTSATLTSPDINTPDIDGGTIDGATIATSDVTVGAGKTLNVSAGTITLADNQISGDKVEGGTIAATTITDLTFGSLNDGTITATAFVDEDNMVSNSATLIPTQQSVKAYVDTTVAATNEVVEDTTPQLGGDLDLNSNDITGTGNINITGTIQSSGNITGTLATAAQPNITSVGTLSALTVDDITINGSTISDTGNLTLDVAGDIILDAGGSNVFFKKAGTSFYSINEVNGNAYVGTAQSDKDLYIRGNDGGTEITALLFDMSAAGAATFNAGASFGSGIDVTGTVTADGLTVSKTSGDIATLEGTGTTADVEANLVFNPVYDVNARIVSAREGAALTSRLSLETGTTNDFSTTERLRVSGNGDISFYEDTGSTAALFWDASAESLGIGTTSPENELHISDSSGNAVVQIESSASGFSQVSFGDVNDGDVGKIKYNHSDNSMSFTTDTAEKMRIDSSDNLLVGTTDSGISNSTSITGINLKPNSATAIVRSGGTTLYLNRLTDEGEILALRKNGSTVGSIGVQGGRLIIGSDDTHIFFDSGDTPSIRPHSGTASTDAIISLGESDARFKDLYLSGTANVGGLTVAGTLGNFAVDTQGAIVSLSRPSTSYIRASDASGSLRFDTGGSVGRLLIANNGDISFYEDTGTTQALFWDASAESLGIGTTSPSAVLDISSVTTSTLRLSNSDTALTEGQITGQLEFYQADTSSHGTGITGKIAMRSVEVYPSSGYYGNAADMDFYVSGSANGYASDNATKKAVTIQAGSGNVGIGTDSPSEQLHVASNVLFSSGVGSGDAVLNVGRSRSADGNVYLDLHSDAATYTDYGLRIIKESGANGASSILHRGTGIFTIETDEAAAIRFNTNSVERMRIDSSGNLRVGVGNTFEPTIQFTNSGRVESNPAYSFNGDLNTGMFNPSSQGQIAFSNDGSESMRIDSSGNLLVGTTDDTLFNNGAGGNTGTLIESNGTIQLAKSNNITAYFNRLDGDGDIVSFRKDGSTVGSIGSSSPALYIGSGDVGVRFDGANDRIRPVGNASNLEAIRDNAIDLGDSGARFKDLYLSGGVYLGGTGAANKLDDYEEGTFSVTVDNLDGFAGTPSSATFTYTKIGNKVFCEGVFFMTGSSGNVAVDDSIQFTSASLPFTPSKLGTCLGAASVQTGAATGDNCAMGYVALADSGVYGIQIHNVNGTVTRNNAKISFKITYETTA